MADHPIEAPPAWHKTPADCPKCKHQLEALYAGRKLEVAALRCPECGWFNDLRKMAQAARARTRAAKLEQEAREYPGPDLEEQAKGE